MALDYYVFGLNLHESRRSETKLLMLMATSLSADRRSQMGVGSRLEPEGGLTTM